MYRKTIFFPALCYYMFFIILFCCSRLPMISGHPFTCTIVVRVYFYTVFFFFHQRHQRERYNLFIKFILIIIITIIVIIKSALPPPYDKTPRHQDIFIFSCQQGFFVIYQRKNSKSYFIRPAKQRAGANCHSQRPTTMTVITATTRRSCKAF